MGLERTPGDQRKRLPWLRYPLAPVSSSSGSLLADQPGSVTIEASARSRVLAIGRDELAALMEMDPDLRFQVRVRSEIREPITSAMSTLMAGA